VRIASVTGESYVDGPGKRIVVHAQGCSLHCAGCQNRHLWDADAGNKVSDLGLANVLHESDLPVTITGGEPFDQPAALHRVLEYVKGFDMWRSIIVYTGYTWEELIATGDPNVYHALTLIDVLVDGRYVRALDAPDMQYRGSSNQRVIDVWATLSQPAGITFSQGPVTLDWDTPELVLTAEGNLLAATPLALAYGEVGELEDTRRCGEVAT